MSPDNDKALCEKYPKIFAKYWGAECGDGWYILLDALCKHLQSLTDCNPNHARFPQIIASQVKEKYGGLRFYTTAASDYQDGAIAMAESMSFRICDVCGAPGNPNTSGWIRTRCETHINES